MCAIPAVSSAVRVAVAIPPVVSLSMVLDPMLPFVCGEGYRTSIRYMSCEWIQRSHGGTIKQIIETGRNLTGFSVVDSCWIGSDSQVKPWIVVHRTIY